MKGGLTKFGSSGFMKGGREGEQQGRKTLFRGKNLVGEGLAAHSGTGSPRGRQERRWVRLEVVMRKKKEKLKPWRKNAGAVRDVEREVPRA